MSTDTTNASQKSSSTDETELMLDEDTNELSDAEALLFMSSEKKQLKKGEYIATVGRRKTSIARVRLSSGTKQTSVTVNNVSLERYFKTAGLQKVVRQPFQKIKYPDAFEITIIVTGGGISGQAQAARHGIARALIQYDIATRPQLKKLGYLLRDPRAKERKKFGHKKARKSSQWSKR